MTVVYESVSPTAAHADDSRWRRGGVVGFASIHLARHRRLRNRRRALWNGVCRLVVRTLSIPRHFNLVTTIHRYTSNTVKSKAVQYSDA